MVSSMNLRRALFLAFLLGCGPFGCSKAGPPPPPPTLQTTQAVRFVFRQYVESSSGGLAAEFTISNTTTRMFWITIDGELGSESEREGLAAIGRSNFLEAWIGGRWIHRAVGYVCAIGPEPATTNREIPPHQAIMARFDTYGDGRDLIRFVVYLNENDGTNTELKCFWTENVPPFLKSTSTLNRHSPKP